MGSTVAETEREGLRASFAMRERPPHAVELTKSFAVGRFEVTRAEFATFADAAQYAPMPGCLNWNTATQKWQRLADKSWRDPGFEQSDRDPVVCVDWADAKAYAAWLSGKAGKNYRLLSETEWEYAARAGTVTARYWGEGLDDACHKASIYDIKAATELDVRQAPDNNFMCDDGHARTAPVGLFPANAFGLHDMLGNVWEWVEDCGHDNYLGAPADGSAWIEPACAERTARGSSWFNTPNFLRSAQRSREKVDQRKWNLGFRVARDLTEGE